MKQRPVLYYLIFRIASFFEAFSVTPRWDMQRLGPVEIPPAGIIPPLRSI